MKNRLIIIFLCSFVGFVLFDWFWPILRFGLQKEAFGGIVISAISGGLFGITIAGFFYGYIRVFKKKYGANSLDIAGSGEIFFLGDIDEIFSKSLCALDNSNAFKEVVPIIGERKIELRTGISWQSFGENVEIRFISVDDGVRAIVTSRPLLKTTMVDYGKNLENIELVRSLLSNN